MTFFYRSSLFKSPHTVTQSRNLYGLNCASLREIRNQKLKEGKKAQISFLGHRVPIFIPWCPLWKTCARWGKGAGEAKSRQFCNCMGWCGISPSFPVVYSQSHGGVTFLSTLLSFLRGNLFLMEVESLWSPCTWSDVPLGHNECWMSGHICRSLPGRDQASESTYKYV